MKPWITYSLIRLGLFAGVFALLFGVVKAEAWLAAVIAALVSLCVSYIFFRGQRDAAVEVLTTKRAPSTDELAED